MTLDFLFRHMLENSLVTIYEDNARFDNLIGRKLVIGWYKEDPEKMRWRVLQILLHKQELSIIVTDSWGYCDV